MKYIKDLPQATQDILLLLFYSQMRDNGFDAARHKDDFLNSKVTDIGALYGHTLELTGGVNNEN